MPEANSSPLVVRWQNAKPLPSVVYERRVNANHWVPINDAELQQAITAGRVIFWAGYQFTGADRRRKSRMN